MVSRDEPSEFGIHLPSETWGSTRPVPRMNRHSKRIRWVWKLKNQALREASHLPEAGKVPAGHTVGQEESEREQNGQDEPWQTAMNPPA